MPPELCGICGKPKPARTYAYQAQFGVKTTSVALCERCDLTGSPPPVRTAP